MRKLASFLFTVVLFGLWGCFSTTQFSVESLLPHSHGEIVRHTDYTLAYAEPYEQPYWVAYIIEPQELEGSARRKNHFRKDPLVSTGSATPDDYRKSGYDRGHLAPAAVMKETPAKMRESFYMSNVSPQTPSFNRGEWKNLEKLVRHWVTEYGELYVVTGPVLTDGLPVIGKNNVAVPNYFYKVIYMPSHKKMVGFLMPNRETRENLKNFIVTVDSVEKVTGIDFFPAMADSLEKALEKEHWDGWGKAL